MAKIKTTGMIALGLLILLGLGSQPCWAETVTLVNNSTYDAQLKFTTIQKSPFGGSSSLQTQTIAAKSNGSGEWNSFGYTTAAWKKGMFVCIWLANNRCTKICGSSGKSDNLSSAAVTLGSDNTCNYVYK